MGIKSLHLQSAKPRKPTKENTERAIDDIVAMVHGGNGNAVRNGLQSLGPPDRLPPYRALLTDVDGVLWALLSHPGDSTTRLNAMSDRGVILGSVEIPREITVFEIGRDYVLALYEESGGEPHVGLFRLRRAP